MNRYNKHLFSKNDYLPLTFDGNKNSFNEIQSIVSSTNQKVMKFEFEA